VSFFYVAGCAALAAHGGAAAPPPPNWDIANISFAFASGARTVARSFAAEFPFAHGLSKPVCSIIVWQCR
jgi:hypothetical protein